jgi:hypothetical protein
MRKITSTMLGFIVAAAGSYSLPALAEDSVIVNGRTFTCTNTCNVTVYQRDGVARYRVSDCCGGRVRFSG